MKTTDTRQIAGLEREHVTLNVLNSTSFCCAFSPCCEDAVYGLTRNEIPQTAGGTFSGYRTIALVPEAC